MVWPEIIAVFNTAQGTVIEWEDKSNDLSLGCH